MNAPARITAAVCHPDCLPTPDQRATVKGVANADALSFAQRLLSGEATLPLSYTRREREEWLTAAQTCLDGEPADLADLIELEDAKERYLEFTDRLSERQQQQFDNEFEQWLERDARGMDEFAQVRL